jgi:hypothetical protein
MSDPIPYTDSHRLRELLHDRCARLYFLPERDRPAVYKEVVDFLQKDLPKGPDVKIGKKLQAAYRRNEARYRRYCDELGLLKPRTVKSKPEPPPYVPTKVDRTILLVLALDGCARTYSQIAQEANRLRREAGRRNKPIDLKALNPDVVKDRAAVLLEQKLIARPLHRDGKPTKRMGVAITDAGRDLLKDLPPSPTPLNTL